MQVHELRPGAPRKGKKRVGRGIGSGHGKTSTRGHKGQKARSGGGKGPAFEGGQLPLVRRVPRKGFNNKRFATHYTVVNLDALNRFEANTVVTPELLLKSGVVAKLRDGIKVLGNGEITKALTVQAQAFSAAAAEKIAAAGGKTEVI